MKRQQTEPVRETFKVSGKTAPRRRSAARRREFPVKVTQANPLALKAAQKLVDEYTQIRLLVDGTVMIVNR